MATDMQGRLSSVSHSASSTDARPIDRATSGDITKADNDSWLQFLTIAPTVPLGRVFYALVTKRVLDVTLASILLLLLAPVLALIALAIQLGGPGNILFRQRRVGRGGELFTVYKFCTMIPDRRQQQRPFPADIHGDRRQRHKSDADPRVTRVGRFLRRTSLDELPQLVNVLTGEMSLIGPRPELPAIVAHYEPWQHERHVVRPGISGWWQVSGRSDKPLHEHTDLDIYYVRQLSFGLDLRILWRTLVVVCSRRGAF